MRSTFILCLLMAGSCHFTYSQSAKNAVSKFGDISVKDFEPVLYPIDSNAKAVILYDGGIATYKSDGKTWFNVVYTYTRRFRIMNKSAFGLATVQIPIYKSEDAEDRIEKLEAYTYNLENGKVVSTKLDKESIFNDKASKTYLIKKFTMPDLKEGCIVEYRYTIISPSPGFLRGWTFHDAYPVLTSEYDITVPNLFNYVVLKSGYFDLSPRIAEEGTQFFTIRSSDSPFASSDVFSFQAVTVHNKWILNDLPAMVSENYTTTMRNHLSRVEFQLKSLNFPNQDPQIRIGSWEQLMSVMLKDKEFGADLGENNKWMENDLRSLVVADQKQTAANIFGFVRDNFVCTDHDAIYMTATLKSAYQAKKGNVAEINLVLAAMLRKAGITAEPVMLSTKDHGIAYQLYPLVNKFNYIITRAEIGNTKYLLDASRKKMGFNRLPEYVYNGYGRVINENAEAIPFSPDSIMQKKRTTVYISNSADGKKLEGTLNSDLGYYESYDLREKLAGTGKDDYLKKLTAGYGFDITVTNANLDSLGKYDEPVSLHYDFGFALNEDMVYFNPLMSEAYKTNPFSAAKRNYPVEMPYTTDETIVVNMEIPTGYVVVEMPKSERLSFNENEGMFEYLVKADKQMIQLKCRLTLNRSFFMPEDYSGLREFFGHIVKKQSEQIVFKKK
ncbi:MAG: DUF3857 domain-containing protein [Ferruginibacter sp.]